MARSYGELQRRQDGGVRCKGTLQRNKYLCSNCRPRHSPCSLFQFRSNVPPLWNNRKMEVCLIGYRPHRDVSPRERLQRGMQPSTYHAKTQHASTPSPLALKMAWESPATLWFAMLRHGNYGQLASRPRCNCFDLPRSKRSRNATSTILRICLCARARAVYRWGRRHKSIGCCLEGTPLCQSRVASSCREVPEGRYEG